MAPSNDPAKTILWVVLAVLGAALLLGLLGASMSGWGGMGGMMGFGWLWMLLPIFLVAVLVIALSGGFRTESTSAESAFATAERRYAAGEISREEFLRIKEDIQGGRRP